MKARVFITGGTGFVGANLVRRLVRDGHEVHLLVRPGYQPWRVVGLEKQVQLHEVFLADSTSVDRVVADIRPQWVFHLAVSGAYSWQKDLDEMVQTNIQGTINLVRAALKVGVEVFVNTGSSSEYGLKSSPPTEESLLEPNSDYAVTKASATLFCQFTAKQDKVRIPTLRLYSAYGPFEDPNRLFPNLVTHGLKGVFPPLVSPDVARDFVYVDDVVDAFIRVAEHTTGDYGPIYNVGTGVQVTLREIVDTAQRCLSIPGEPVWSTMAARSWDTKSWVADSRRIKNELGWRPSYGLEEGFKAFAKWYAENACFRSAYEVV